MSDKPFIIYKSSAGSGKTYTLATEYLKLALAHPTAFKSILAVTFTNKATQEMKERILKELARLKRDVYPGETMDRALLEYHRLQPEQLKSRAGEVLSAILHDYSNFSVSTIDSFFQKVVRAFAREMDLQAKFDIELDQDAVLERVVEMVIMQVMEDPYLHRWLVDYAKEQIQEGKSWDIRRNIRDLGKQVFQEDFKRFQREIREFLKDKDRVDQLLQHIRESRKAILLETRRLNTLANQIRERYGLEWEDFSGGSRSFAKKFDQLGDLQSPVPQLTPTQKKLLESTDGWASKSSKQKNAIFSASEEGLMDILGQLEPLESQWNTVEALWKNFYVYGIFRHLLDALGDLKEEENILFVSDANDFLKEITRENEVPFVYEKVGNKFQHFLIDEFQDTSGFQWASFKPLLENSLAEKKTNLLVGDVKQSIYRWRGGEMKLLLEEVEEQTGRFGIEVKNLQTNYRSLSNIIHFNNALFALFPARLEATLQEKERIPNVDILSRAYQDVSQEVTEHKSKAVFKGKVKIEFLEAQKEPEPIHFKEQVTAKIPGMVMELQDHGYALRDIAFLVRTKAEGELVADTLMEYGKINQDTLYGFDVLSDEALFLEKSASVKGLVAGLKYLLNPEDRVSFKTMWYYRSLLFEDPVDHSLFALHTIPDYLKEPVHRFRIKEQELLQLPLLEMVEEMIELLGICRQSLEKAYISAFKEAIYDYCSKNRADLSGFLAWWEEQKTKRTVKIPTEHNAMRILTIHKSKGLQFKVVLMPFMDWTIFDTKKNNIVWSPYPVPGTDLHAIIPLTLKKELASSAFSTTYSEEVILAYLDTLNLFYVAVTRAEEVFWGLAPYKLIKKDTSKNSLSIHLQEILEHSPFPADQLDLNSYYDYERKAFELGEWGEIIHFPVIADKPYPLRWGYKNWNTLLSVKKKAVDFSTEGMEQRSKRNFGLLIHQILEKSKNLEEALGAVKENYFEGSINEEEMRMVNSQLERLFSLPDFKEWSAGLGVLLAEQGILLPGGKHKRPDRIILYEDKAVVVDFKTGEERSSYENQVREYMDLVGKLTQLRVSGYLCYIESASIKEVKANG